jgi:acyl-CoA synthetase (AMP-forming)/AMP-acid ligase II
MRGYLDDRQATASMVDADGWVHTGDVVTLDGEGWFRITDRIKELIKYKGFQVAPAELDDGLLTHPAVADVAVVRSPDEHTGEVPKAFIVPRGPVAADELMAWVAKRVALNTPPARSSLRPPPLSARRRVRTSIATP